MTRLIGEMVPEGEVGEIAKVPDSFRIARFAKFGDAGKGKGRTVLAAWSVWGDDTHWKLPEPSSRPARLFGQNVEPTRAAVQGCGWGVDLTGRGEERR